MIYAMTSGQELSADERRYFALVTQAVKANPFDEKRLKLDLQIAGIDMKTPRFKVVDRALAAVAARIQDLEKENRADVSRYSAEDALFIRNAVLFEFFYTYRQRFDDFIKEQLKAGDTPLKVPFAAEALAHLIRRGFSTVQATHYFALCFQIRRAFYFIFRHLVGRSASMGKLRQSIWNNVFTHDLLLYEQYLWDRMEDFSTLIAGETGAGKGTVAMAIGQSGYIPFNERRKIFVESFTKVFVAVNLSQFSENLIESELFGHKKGAFTGAVKEHKGVLEQCSPYGAILLDEIGDISAQIQIKLLQVLQDRIFRPVGSHETAEFKGRVVAATNRPLEEIRKGGLLRDDFFYRLSSDIIFVPPLKDRIIEDPGELDDLLAHTVARLLGRPSKSLAAMIKKVIAKTPGPDYPWPGNVRELEQCVRRILLKHSYEGEADIRPPSTEAGDLARRMEQGTMDTQELITGYCAMLYRRFGSFEETARRTRLDPRTVKKYVQEWEERQANET